MATEVKVQLWLTAQ